jgi:hypothetical protein|tara:strand:+ start:347 stop:508 length:162 start_codon:yes stop_codon:yes gene_type:complete
MSLFKMYPKRSESKEAINKCQATDKIEAINIFSRIKRLTLEQFKNLFKVEKIR